MGMILAFLLVALVPLAAPNVIRPKIPTCTINSENKCNTMMVECYHGEYTLSSCSRPGYYLGVNDFVYCDITGAATLLCKTEKDMSLDITTMEVKPLELNTKFCNKVVTQDDFLSLCNVVKTPLPDEPTGPVVTKEPEVEPSTQWVKCQEDLPYRGKYDPKTSRQMPGYYKDESKNSAFMCVTNSNAVFSSCPIDKVDAKLLVIDPENKHKINDKFMCESADIPKILVVDEVEGETVTVERVAVTKVSDKKAVSTNGMSFDIGGSGGAKESMAAAKAKDNTNNNKIA